MMPTRFPHSQHLFRFSYDRRTEKRFVNNQFCDLYGFAVYDRPDVSLFLILPGQVPSSALLMPALLEQTQVVAQRLVRLLTSSLPRPLRQQRQILAEAVAECQQ